MSGLGIGDGFMSPPDSSIYADFLFYAGLIGTSERTELLQWEDLMKSYASQGRWRNAWEAWNSEFDLFLTSMGCFYYYGFTICDTPLEEDNYEDFLRLPTTRKAIHTGNLHFGEQSGQVYYSMLDVFMRSERETVEFLLERYPVSGFFYCELRFKIEMCYGGFGEVGKKIALRIYYVLLKLKMDKKL